MSRVSLPLRARLAPLAAVLIAALAVPAFVVQESIAAGRETEPAERSATRATPATAATPAAPGSPATPGTPSAPAKPGKADCDVLIGTCTSVHSSNGNMSITLGEPGRRLRFESTGQVRFNAQDTAVESLGSGARVSCEETVGGETRKVEYTGSGTALQTRYWRNGTEQALDADGQAWIARIVPQLLREAAIDVEGRVARLHARGGTDAVLSEVALIRSDYAKGRYLAELLRTQKLAGAELDRALQQVSKMGSDYEKRQVLSAVLASQEVGRTQWLAVMSTVADIGSDYERSQLLVDSARRVAGDDELRAAWLKASAETGSDFERRRSLEALLGESRTDTALVEIMDAGSSIGSDFELRELLSRVARKAGDTNTIAAPYAKTAKRLGSDFERREALVALVRAGTLKRDGALAVLDAASGIGSDFECGTVLVEVARHLPDDAAVRERLLQLAGRLSDHERRQVENAAGVVRG